MLFKRVNRTDPEQIFVVVFNNEGASLSANNTCQLELASASVDGVKVRQPDTGNLFAFVGIVDAAIADQAYGLVQIYGYRSTVTVFQTNTSQATGQPLVPVAGVGYMATSATTLASNTTITFLPIFAVLAESITDSAGSATVNVKAFIRAMTIVMAVGLSFCV